MSFRSGILRANLQAKAISSDDVQFSTEDFNRFAQNRFAFCFSLKAALNNRFNILATIILFLRTHSDRDGRVLKIPSLVIVVFPIHAGAPQKFRRVFRQ